MSFKKAKCNGAYRKDLGNGDYIHYFYDGMVFAEIVINAEGMNIESPHNTFKTGTKPAIELTKKATK